MCIAIQGALQAYEKASQILTDSVGADIPPEILSNIGALHHKLDNLEEATQYLISTTPINFFVHALCKGCK